MDKIKINGISSYDLFLELLYLKKIYYVFIIFFVVVVFV